MDFWTQLDNYFPEKDSPYWSLRQYAETHADEARGQGHLLFAAYAAFPMLLTPDLLYKIWLNFRQNAGEDQAEIPRVVVSDVLVSDLLSEVGPEVFEMNARVRDFLIGYLEGRPEGEERLRQLAEFMFYYSTNTLFSNPGFPENLLEILRWNALAFFNPAKAVSQLKEQLRVAYTRKDELEYTRLNRALERIDWRLASLRSEKYKPTAQAFRALLSYNRGVRAFFRGDMAEAVANLEQIPGYRIGSGGLASADALPVPRVAQEELARRQQKARFPKERKVYALLLGINQYQDTTVLPLAGPVNDVSRMAEYCSERFPANDLQLTKLTNAEVTYENVQRYFLEFLQQAEDEDLLLFFFAGHGRNRAEGAEHNTLLFYDYQSTEKEGSEAQLTDKDFRQFIQRFGPHDPYITLILDTDAGSDRWLDKKNDKHLILSACREDETSIESRGRGHFSQTLLEILAHTNNQLTYRRLGMELLQRMPAAGQTPQVFGTETALDRLFLSTAEVGIAHLQERLQRAGYYDGPVDGRASEVVTQALNRFREEYNIGQEEDILHLLQYKALLGTNTRLLVLILQGPEPRRLPSKLMGSMEKLPFKVEIHTYQVAGSAESNIPAKRPPEEIEYYLLELHRSHYIISLFDDHLEEDDLGRQLVNLQETYLHLDLKKGYTINLLASAPTQTNSLRKIEKDLSDFSRLLPNKEEETTFEMARRIEAARGSKELDLSNLDLQQIPDQVFELTTLQKLVLTGNRLKSLPKKITQLKKLRSLHADKNQLTDISALREMTGLTFLNLYRNEIADLSPLSELTKLKHLNLSTNRIVDLSSLSELTKLRGLDLDKNQVKDPSPLFNLKAPEWIDLRYNQLTNLPPEVVKWGLDLKWENDYNGGLILEGNSLEGGWSEKIQRDPERAWEELAEGLNSSLGHSVDQPVILLASMGTSIEDDRLKSSRVIFEILQPLEKQGYQIYREEALTVEQLQKISTEYGERLVACHLMMAQENTLNIQQKQGGQISGELFPFLSQCPQLKFLSVYSSNRIESLSQTALSDSIPVLMESIFPPEDPMGIEFLKAFFKSWQDGEPMKKAFQHAESIVKTGKFEEQAISIHLNATNPQSRYLLYTRLIDPGERPDKIDEQLDFEPNEWFNEHLPQILAPYSEEIASLFEREKKGRKFADSRWRAETLNFLPVPLAEHLRRLMAAVDPDDYGFDNFGKSRLEQIHLLFQYFMQYINGIFLAWLHSESELLKAGIPERLRTELKTLRDVSKSVPDYNYASLFNAFRDIHRQQTGSQQTDAELINLLVKVLNGNEVGQILRFFQSLTPSTLPENKKQLAASCRQAEIQITSLFERLAFLFQYKMTSIRDVNVVRIKPKLRYKAVIVNLFDILTGMDEENHTTDLPLDPQSVILYQLKDEQIPRSYLNLSPFWLDETSFSSSKGNRAKLYVFDHWDDAKELYLFRSIFQPQEFLEISVQNFPRPYENLKSFFDKFDQLDSAIEESVSTTFTDPRDHQSYPTVTWKGHRWLGANLNYDIGEGSWYYEDDLENAERHGRFYTWEAARAACPPGWRLPTLEEWKELATDLGGYTDLTTSTEKGDPQAGFFALEGGESFGFNFRLSGWLDTFKMYRQRGSQGGYWSDTLKDDDEAYCIVFNGEDNQLQISSNFCERVQMSVRCVEKDPSEQKENEDRISQSQRSGSTSSGGDFTLSKNQLIEEWYRLHYEEMRRYATRLARGRTEEAEDVVQDLFLELSELSREELEEIEQPRDYFQFWVKKSLEKAAKRQTVSIEETILDFIDPGEDLARKIKREEDFTALNQALQSLDEKAREIITLQLKGASIAEITKMAGLKNETTTRTVLYRIRKSLQSRLSNL